MRVIEGEHLVIIARDGWEYVERKSAREAVAIIAVTDDGRVVLTEQERRAVGARVIDLPAGLVGDDGTSSDPADAARRELEEETGYSCRSVQLIERVPTSPGITSEMVSFYRATGLRQTSEGGGVGGEDITVHTVPRSELAEWLSAKQTDGLLVDVKVWAALHWL